MHHRLAYVVMLVACSSAPSPEPVAPRTAPADAPIPVLTAVPIDAPLAAAAVVARRCTLDPEVVPMVAAVAEPPCRRPSATIQKAIRTTITKQYRPVENKGKPVITFGCDGLGARIREIVVELGNGHGGSLSLWRARLDANDTYQVHGILYRESTRAYKATRIPFEHTTGSISRAQLEPRLAVVRAALAATLREVVPPPPPNTISMGTISSSSYDFHVLVRVVDEDGRVREGSFTGYAGGEDQRRYLFYDLASEELKAITSLVATAGPATDADRELFAERFVADVPKFDAEYHWWVMERYVDLARFLGSRATLPGLLTRVRATGTGRSTVDAKADAVAAIATITGWDARVDAKNQPRSIDDAAAAYAAECAP